MNERKERREGSQKKDYLVVSIALLWQLFDGIKENKKI